MTVTHGNIEHGSILIRDGKIAAVGTYLKAPEGAAVIDATGEYVIPGIVDCHSHIAIDGGVNEGAPAVSSMANIKDVLNPDDIDIYRDLAGGRYLREYSARQRESHRRADDCDQVALGEAGERIAV